jgi:hypothetical protein
MGPPYWTIKLRRGSDMSRIIFVTEQAYSFDYAGFFAASSLPVLSRPFTPDKPPNGRQANVECGSVTSRVARIRPSHF